VFIEGNSVATTASIVDIDDLVLNSKSNQIPKRKKNIQNRTSTEQPNHHESSIGKDGDGSYNTLIANDKKKS